VSKANSSPKRTSRLHVRFHRFHRKEQAANGGKLSLAWKYAWRMYVCFLCGERPETDDPERSMTNLCRNAACWRKHVRRAVLNLIFAAFIAGSVYDIVTDQEHWPFSQYPMFSSAWTSPTFTWLRVFGVTADGK